MSRPNMRKRGFVREHVGVVSLAATVVILVVLYFIPLPYYFFLPGEAMNLQPLISVQGGHKTAKGTLMLTTVDVLYANNVYSYLYGLLQPDHQLYTAQELSGGFSDRQYNDIEQYMMQSAHQDAVIAAMRFLHKPVVVTVQGVQVISVDSNSLAKGVLQPGDIITAIGHVSLVKNPAAMYTELTHYKPGQTVTLTIVHGKKTRTATVPLIGLPPLPGQKGTRAGIGFLPAVAQTVSTPDHVVFHTGNIEGPSAGLMFTLEIINQLYPGEDLTRGYKIAGTGTIDPTGQVGQIGGAAHKVADANAAGAEIFFVPADVAPGDTNALHAIQEGKQLGTHMKIVPVRTLAQVVAYLRSLPPKAGV
ncbi:MAG: PDZ domain-containing protein [Firmicutes bacterium]|nr:PDZ domain-containing protein [Bacillota bacterium]